MMEVDINDICRACLTHQEGMLSLYDIYEHDLTLAAILKSCIHKEVFEGDGFPSHLCDNCILVLTQFYNFTVVYEESENQLRSILLKEDIKNEDEDLVDAMSEYEDQLLEESDFQQPDMVEIYESEDSSTIQTNYDAENITDVFQQHEGDKNACIKIEAVEVSLSPNEEYADEETMFLSQTDDYESNTDVHSDDHNAKYECQYCGEVYLYERYLLSHIHLEHSKELNNNSSRSLNDHIEKSKISNNTINENNIKTKDNSVTEMKFKDPSLEEITKYECDICGEAYLYQSSFQSHMRLKHKKDDINCDEYCTKFYVKVKPKQERSYNRSFEEIQAPPDRPFACNLCPRRFRHAYMLEHHKEVHSDKKKYVCDVCGKGFVRKTYLDDHMEGHSAVKKHVCKFCGKAFQRRTVLRAHKRTHTHPNYYVCELCGRGFTSTSTLKTHTKLIHIRERNFKCVICMQTFPLKSTLAKHIRRHLNKNKAEKDFPCSQCNMQYRDKSSLKRHIEIKHLGKSVIVSCPDCPKKYTSKANLMKHRRRHHLDE